MKSLLLTPFFLVMVIFAANAEDGMVTLESPHSAQSTAERLVAIVEAAGATVFARIDHAAGAASIGSELEPTILVIFGNPMLGTPVLQASRLTGIDLPVRVLIWEEDGVTRLAYLSASGLAARYGVEGADDALGRISGALEKLTGAAIAP